MAADGRRRSGATREVSRRRGRRPGRTGEQTRATILATAQRMFGEAGFRGVSMARLAAACDLDARALYHHFGSKRGLFDAAVGDAFACFGQEVLARAFAHERAVDRLHGYVDAYRTLHDREPHVLAMIGRALVEILSDDGTTRAGADGPIAEGERLRQLLESVVDEAIERGEVAPDLDRDGLVLLLSTIGMGLALASLDDSGAFAAMLDALDRLSDGSIFTARARARRRRPG
ncbi:MAG: TetR/AcrR family transcriptional regulator [Actinobacteria bacterium]|nr:TetR/AcrR family transcriptional regulator [Actinomycetota bacterium]